MHQPVGVQPSRPPSSPLSRLTTALLAGAALLLPGMAAAQIASPTPACTRVVRADVVALDQVYYWNRLGAVEPQGMIYALERDVVHVDQDEDSCLSRRLPLSEGKVRLRRGKRPRPLVLRANRGDCIDVHFRNLLAPMKVDEEQPATREASVHVVGLPYRTAPEDGGMWIGDDPSGLVAPGQSRVYRIYAEHEGTFLLYSGGAMVGGQGDGGSISAGLFGAVNIQPPGARYFRSQVSEKDLSLATTAVDPQGFPTIDYTKTYQGNLDPDHCWRVGSPILEMTWNDTIVHSDLTAIVTGPNLGAFTSFDYPLDNPVYAEARRNEPYREFTIVFHDETGAVQAFPHFEDKILSHTLHSVRDAFAINYGTGGIGAEILANRLKVGPMHDCLDCKYEEFFLTSWVVGDPAMIVDKPANWPCGDTPSEWDDLRHGVHTACQIPEGPKATKALYPDDPSNVYHSYMNDHVKFRNVHAGTDDHHIFHLHAHQWEHTPKSNRSSYMDSQAIGQATSFTYEIAFEGSGNRPKTVGDSIFHCHFYPHFAQGMWAMWRVHDTLELGTELDNDGKPVTEVDPSTGKVVTVTRALPDDEIVAGTPIPGLVPLPGKALAPPPTDVRLLNGQIDVTYTTNQALAASNAGSPFFSPGYPFFIPGIAGARPPHPPLDFALDGNGQPRDGGLPRHVVLSGQDDPTFYAEAHTRLDFHKHVLEMDALHVPEEGTTLEQLAMKTHSVRDYNTPTANNVPPAYPYQHNGGEEKQGAPYADPCLTDQWLSDWNGTREPVPTTRLYQAADIELDVVLNKAGWHFPQQRLAVLVDDVQATVDKTRPPEPLFFRANSRDCVVFELTNLVPYEYQVDDFQVRTPTDVLGQHIHLVKFDVTSSDGAANGYNYEDGSLSPEEVQERIDAIRIFNECEEQGIDELTVHPTTGHLYCPVAKEDPRFTFLSGDRNCNGFDDVLGAQTTVQRWWADPIEDESGHDRTLQTVFTHDHFGPSTHQQAGLYAGLVVEREGSLWYDNETTTVFGNRYDGGPTSWAARIEPPDAESFREFMIELADFQLAYERNTVWQSCPHPKIGWADPKRAINPPGRESIGPPDLYRKPQVCPTNPDDPDGTILASNDVEPPCPEAVSADDPGFVSVNYRSEPIPFRIADTFEPGQTPQQVLGLQGDLSWAYASQLPGGVQRAIGEMNKRPDATLTHVPYPGLTQGLELGDPFTPLLRAYEGDKIRVKALVGAHEEEHNFSVHGNRWLFEPYDPDSGYRASQMMGISEYMEFHLGPAPEILGPDEKFVDYLYKPSSATEFQWNGAWGLLRMYQGTQAGLPTLSDNPDGFFGKNNSFRTPAERAAVFDEAPAESVEPQPIAAPVGKSHATVPIACPAGAPREPYDITAVAAYEVLPAYGAIGRSLVYNPRPDFVGNKKGPLHDPTAILFVETDDLDYSGGRPVLKGDAPVEPIILRASAGKCIELTLRNDLPGEGISPVPFAFDLPGWSGWHMLFEGFNANQVAPSSEVGLRPQLVFIDPRQGDGTNVGMNPAIHGKQTVAPGEKVTYYWYAGRFEEGFGGGVVPRTVEYGSTGLASSDPLEHTQKGAVGALIIEPINSTWTLADTHGYLPFEAERRTRAEATVSPGGGQKFREFVVVAQDDVNLRYDDPQLSADDPVANLGVNEDPTESGQKAFGYRAEPIWFRMGHRPETPETQTRDFQFADALTDAKVGGDPVTHTFDADPGDRVRFRLVHPGGHTQSHVLEVQGHNWPELPFLQSSDKLGLRADSEWQGARHGIGPTCHADQLIPAAGGPFSVEGQYLYRDYVAWGFDHGMWGIFWVHAGGTP